MPMPPKLRVGTGSTSPCAIYSVAFRNVYRRTWDFFDHSSTDCKGSAQVSGYDHISCRDGYSMDYRTHRSNQFALRQKAEPPFRSGYQRHYYLRYLCANFLAGIPSSTVLCDSSEMVQCLTKSRLEGLFTTFICPGGSQFVFTHPNYAFLSSG